MPPVKVFPSIAVHGCTVKGPLIECGWQRPKAIFPPCKEPIGRRSGAMAAGCVIQQGEKSNCRIPIRINQHSPNRNAAPFVLIVRIGRGLPALLPSSYADARKEESTIRSKTPLTSLIDLAPPIDPTPAHAANARPATRDAHQLNKRVRQVHKMKIHPSFPKYHKRSVAKSPLCPVSFSACKAAPPCRQQPIWASTSGEWPNCFC